MTSTTKNAVRAPAAKTPVEDVPGNLGKTQLVASLLKRAGLSRREGSALRGVTLEVIAEAIRGRKTVGLPGLGTLSVKATTARQDVRAGSEEKIQIPAGKKVGYKVALNLKTSL